MSEFLSPAQMATLPVAVAVVSLIANVLRRSFQANPSWMALGISLVYALAVFVWPLPATAATAQEWAVRVVVAIVAAFMVAAGASDLSGRLAPKQDPFTSLQMEQRNQSLMRRWY